MNDIKKMSLSGTSKGISEWDFQETRRSYYGYAIGPDGELAINPDKATVVRWIFGHYLNGDSLGKIAAGLKERGIASPTGRPKWNRESLNKLLSNEKYTGRVLF